MIALLRGINVGGRSMVTMADLRALLEMLHFENVRSILQSGNLVFDTPHPPLRGTLSRGERGDKDIEALLEKESKKRLGLETDFFVRSAKELAAIIDANPFPKEAKNDPGRLVVLFLKGSGDGKALQKAIKDREIARGEGRQIYVYYPDGQGRSRLTNAIIEKTLGTRVTARNWNTVLKLHHADDSNSA
jgi:uncharacterized protein (DUF1697 family)